jgi:hypothetical protein
MKSRRAGSWQDGSYQPAHGRAAFSHISDERADSALFQKERPWDQGWRSTGLDLGDWIRPKDSSSSPERVAFAARPALLSGEGTAADADKFHGVRRGSGTPAMSI